MCHVQTSNRPTHGGRTGLQGGNGKAAARAANQADDLARRQGNGVAAHRPRCARFLPRGWSRLAGADQCSATQGGRQVAHLQVPKIANAAWAALILIAPRYRSLAQVSPGYKSRLDRRLTLEA